MAPDTHGHQLANGAQPRSHSASGYRRSTLPPPGTTIRLRTSSRSSPVWIWWGPASPRRRPGGRDARARARRRDGHVLAGVGCKPGNPQFPRTRAGHEAVSGSRQGAPQHSAARPTNTGRHRGEVMTVEANALSPRALFDVTVCMWCHPSSVPTSGQRTISGSRSGTNVPSR